MINEVSMKKKNTLFNVTALVTLAAGLSVLVACQNKGSGGSQDAPPPPAAVQVNNIPNNPCNNCFSNLQLLLGQVKTQSPSGSVQGVLDIYADGSMVGYDFNNPKIITQYSGLSLVSGTLNMRGLNSVASCFLPDGSYSIRTIQPGMLHAGSFFKSGYYVNNTLLLEANSTNLNPPIQAVLHVGSANVYNTEYSGLSKASLENRIGLNFSVQTLNGIACPVNTISTF